MNSKEFLEAVDFVEKEKGISKENIFEFMETALNAAYKKNYGIPGKVIINRDTGEIKVYSFKTVVPDDKVGKDYDELNENPELDEEGNPIEVLEFDPEVEITLSDARKIKPDYEVGDTVDEEVVPKDFGRVATSTAKQVLTQKLRESEKQVLIDTFGDKKDELLIGTVELEDTDNYFINLGHLNGILPKKECIPGEHIEMGTQIKVYVSKVDTTGKGVLVLLSRNHYGFLKRLFELEIPEVNDGTVLVYSVAREAGNRSKIAVYSEYSNIDPIGACIGERGSRINRIIDEINGEHIDVVKYDKEADVFIANALSPAKNLHVIITDDKNKEAMVIADEDNFSLAIGKKGLNARLASKLTKYKIDIKSEADAAKEGIYFK